jgi:hypothetical protein
MSGYLNDGRTRLHVPRRWSVGLTLVALLASVPGVAGHAPDPALSGRWNQNQALTYSWRAGSVPDSEVPGADQRSRGGRDRFPRHRPPRSRTAPGRRTSSATEPGQRAARADRLLQPQRTDQLLDVDARAGCKYDWGSLRWCQYYSTWPDGCFDVENIMLDEFGHVEILNHHANYSGESDYLDAVVQTKSHAKPQTGWNVHAFARCDVATLQVQYDMQGWGAKYSTCLDLTTTLTLGASAGYVGYGGTVTLTATLKVANDRRTAGWPPIRSRCAT